MRENVDGEYPQKEEKKHQDVFEQHDDLRDRLIDLREDIVREVRAMLDTETLMSRLRGLGDQKTTNEQRNGDARTKDVSSIHGKKFSMRESELTNLMKINHIATIYNVFVATLISLFLSTVVHDVIGTGSVNLGFHLLSWNFSQFHITVLIWMEMMVLAVLLYYGYLGWAKLRSTIKSKLHIQLVDKLCLGLLTGFLILHMALPCIQVRLRNLPLACSMTVACEQVRLLMKMYAFIRTNVPRTIQSSASSQGVYLVPSFSKYLYFLFAPTLIYRDEYPRTKTIRWGYAAARFAEVVSILFYLAFVAERYMLPRMRDFGSPGTSLIQMVPLIIDMAVPSAVGIVCIFYAILHAWLNGMAEILRFGDRMFYNDWWNTTVYAEYYKKWNIVVYDWLYTFIYKDAGVVLLSNRYARAILVIAVSAIFHEYIMAFGLGFFLPVFIVVYGFGGPLVMQLSSSNAMIGNVWIWSTLCIGSGLMVTLYLAEYYARINCPSTSNSTFWDFFIPRLATCPYS